MRFGRVLLVILLLAGGLTSATALAQPAGSELTEPITADAAGEEAYVALESVEAFPAGGGQAVLEAGSPYEETVTYVAADPDTNRLVGLTRPSPLAHPVGASVQAPEAPASPVPQATATPTASPADEAAAPTAEQPSQGNDPADGGDAGNTVDDAGADAGDSVAPPEPCEIVLGASCAEILAGVVGDPCAELSSVVCEFVDDLEVGDPIDDLCDPNDVGQTCNEWLAQFVGDPVDDLCDPQDVGQTCEQWVMKQLVQLIGDPQADLMEPAIGPIPEEEMEGPMSPADVLAGDPTFAPVCAAVGTCGSAEPRCNGYRHRLKWVRGDGKVVMWVEVRLVWCWEGRHIYWEQKDHDAGGDPKYIYDNRISIIWDGWLPGTGRICDGGRCSATSALGAWCMYQQAANDLVMRSRPWAGATGYAGGASRGGGGYLANEELCNDPP